MIWRSDGTQHPGPRTDFTTWQQTAVDPGRFQTGDRLFRLGDNWLIGDVDGAHMSIGYGADKKTAVIYRSDGTIHSGPRTDYGVWSRAVTTTWGAGECASSSSGSTCFENPQLCDCTEAPTRSPTPFPTVWPSFRSPMPSAAPSASPTRDPTIKPTAAPTLFPTFVPTHKPSSATAHPTVKPTFAPTLFPTFSPSTAPTGAPTLSPSSLQYNAVATWPVTAWGAWPFSAGTQAFCVEASATAFTNPVDVSSMAHNEHKNTMFIQCCSLAGVASTRDCSSTEGRSWAEAKEFCDAKSERLCTTSELLLTWSKGCLVDGVDSRAWSSDSC